VRLEAGPQEIRCFKLKFVFVLGGDIFQKNNFGIKWDLPA
jgi:hypothetical protein